ncbi:MotA/TolQ/ExbB proton channel family protein [Ferrimonas lipolytica]|uniref:MotA/TolQ/ExbB proton channel family protein n=1 Tax=Ferrimonas lipolytica TaxID=2724191 RepID=A0A6H1UI09_9GAMM|nr:MotA/TolQ/ExbB proton channel family protein [Ferrimonas lipolytica]QIZ78674.1 MotA/TolQ/ExbB proton channel family protein [Ferrimonas lipolytica]
MKPLLWLTLFFSGLGLADPLAVQVEQQAQAMHNANNQWQQQLNNEQQRSSATSAELKQQLQQKTKQMQQLQAQLVALQADKKALQQQKAAAETDMALVDSSFRQTTAQLQQRWQTSPTRWLAPQRNLWLQQQTRAEGFPSSAALTQLIQFALDDIEHSGQRQQTEVAIAGAGGESYPTTLTILGSAMVIAEQQAQPLGLLDSSNGNIVAPLPSNTNEQLLEWLRGKSASLPLDISQGSILATLAASHSWQQWVIDGGELLQPILLLALAGLFTLAICTVRLYWWRPLQPLGNDNIEQQLQQQRRAPAAQVLAQAWQQQQLEAMDHHLKQGMLRQFGQFERGLGLVALFAALAPMLGLLGTVSGMIETFQALTEYGNAEPKLLSSGISKALITTQAGLMVAIPLLLLHHPVKRRAQRLTSNMEQQAALLMAQRVEQQ